MLKISSYTKLFTLSFEQLHQEVMGLHHEIKLLMRWSFGTLLAIGGLIVAVLRLAP